jgi:hypothetical protein
VTIAFSMVPGSSTLPQWVGLFGCAYIIVRALSNMIEAVERWKSAKEAERHLQPQSPVAPPSDKSPMVNLENRIRAMKNGPFGLQERLLSLPFVRHS